MSNFIEELLHEAWSLGIKDRVMEKVTEKQNELNRNGQRFIDRDKVYEESFKEAKLEREKSKNQ